MICYHCNKETKGVIKRKLIECRMVELFHCEFCRRPLWEDEARKHRATDDSAARVELDRIATESKSVFTNPELLKPLGCYATDLLHD